MKQHAPATIRNRAPLAAVLDGELPESGTVLEIASGSGEHAIYFAERYPDLVWQPSDPSSEALASIAEWRAEAGLANLLAPVRLDAGGPEWPIDRADAILCVNMVHISPWSATEGLFKGAAELLPVKAPLILYGPYLEAEVQTAASNLAFDESLRARNSGWGLRNLRDVDALANGMGFNRSRRVEMPANNLTLVYRKG
jgi:hypothetical protein